MEFQDREKNILAIASVLVVLIVFMFVFRPSGQKFHELKTSVIKLEEEQRAPQITKQDLEDIDSKVKALEKEISILRYQIPDTERRGFLIRDIESLATKNKIELLNFLPKEAVPVTMTGKEITKRMTRARRRSRELEEHHAKVLKTVINIDSQGKFDNYRKFFTDIITYYRAVEVTDLIITRSGTAKGRGEDKRFARKRKSKDPLEDAANTDLSVTFTLIAYTAINT